MPLLQKREGFKQQSKSEDLPKSNNGNNAFGGKAIVLTVFSTLLLVYSFSAMLFVCRQNFLKIIGYATHR